MNRRRFLTLATTVPVATSGCIEELPFLNNSNEIEAALYEQLNDIRDEHDLRQLERDAPLDTAARSHSEDMAERDFYDHTNPDGDGPAHRMADEGRQCDPWEVIAAANGYTTGAAEDMLDSLMSSPPHREVILEPSLTHVGIGVALAGDGDVLGTIKFCSIAGL